MGNKLEVISSKKIYQVNAFTDTPFKGNPAGVMLVDDVFTETQMQLIAAELNLSETAFVIPHGTQFKIRYFTPTIEVPLCGHATLASAHVLYTKGVVSSNECIEFLAQDTILKVCKTAEGITMDFPQYPLEQIAIPSNFKAIVGFEPIEMYTSQYQWNIAVADHADTIINATPNIEALAKSAFSQLMITAPSNDTQFDFVVRCFAPNYGINEDPVTGSAHCALTPLWASKLGKKRLRSKQVSKREGYLLVELLDERVLITGSAVTVFEAALVY